MMATKNFKTSVTSTLLHFSSASCVFSLAFLLIHPAMAETWNPCTGCTVTSTSAAKVGIGFPTTGTNPAVPAPAIQQKLSVYIAKAGTENILGQYEKTGASDATSKFRVGGGNGTADWAGMEVHQLWGTNTGNNLAFFAASGTSSIERFTVLGNGFVGVNTTGIPGGLPRTSLEVNGNGVINGGIRISNGYFEVDGVNAAATASGGTNNLRFGYFATGRVGFNLQGTEALSMLTNGNVGIGTLTPGAKLDVAGLLNVANRAIVTGNTAGQEALVVNQTQTGTLVDFRKAGASKFIVTDGGNVGVGTVNPAAKLDLQDASFNQTGILNSNINYGVGVTGNYAANKMTSAFGGSSSGTLTGLQVTATHGGNGGNLNGNVRGLDVSVDNAGSGSSYAASFRCGAASILLGRDKTGWGGSFLGINNAMGSVFDITSAKDRQVTEIGVNYTMNSSDGIEKYAVNGLKKAPYLQMDAENGTLSLFGENGAPAAGYRVFSKGNLGLFVQNDGRVGVGTSTPKTALDINGNANLKGSLEIEGDGNYVGNAYGSAYNDRWMIFMDGAAGNNGKLHIQTGDDGDEPILFEQGSTVRMIVTNKGVGIGNRFVSQNPVANIPNAQLEVSGDAIVSGALNVGSVVTKTWSIAPDYVFDKTYKLASLDHVEKYLNENKHLPEIPSAKEIKEKGMDLADMNLKLLKKVEELTLYSIQLEKRVQKLEGGRIANSSLGKGKP